MTRWEIFWTSARYYAGELRTRVRHFFGWFVCKWQGHRLKFSSTVCPRCGHDAPWMFRED